MVAAYSVIYKQSDGAYGKGHSEHYDGKPVIFRAERIPADRGCYNGWYSAERADKKPHGNSDIRQAGGVAQKILGRSGDHEYDKIQKVAFLLRFQELHALQLFPGKEYLHELRAIPPYQPEHEHAAHCRGHDAQYCPLDRAERIAARDLKRFAGQHRDDNLKDDHPDICRSAAYPVSVDPLPKFFGLGCEFYKRNSCEPCYQRYNDNGNYYSGNADGFLLLCCELFILPFHIRNIYPCSLVLLLSIIINAIFLINSLPTKFTIYPTMLHIVQFKHRTTLIIILQQKHIQCIICISLATTY